MPDLQPYLPALVISLIVILAIIAAILIFKLFNQRVRGRRGQRLGITEFHEIDKMRRLILVRRDDVEHLVMIGGNQDMVIETRIESGLMASVNQASRGTSEDQVPMRPPKPAVFGGRRPVLRTVEPNIVQDSSEQDGSDDEKVR